MSNSQDFMLRITGYSDRFSVRPGENINFHVHSENEESYQADIVRLIHGDTNPDGPLKPVWDVTLKVLFLILNVGLNILVL